MRGLPGTKGALVAELAVACGGDREEYRCQCHGSRIVAPGNDGDATVSNRERGFVSSFCLCFSFPFLLLFLLPVVLSFLFYFPFPFCSSFLPLFSPVSLCFSPFCFLSFCFFFFCFFRSSFFFFLFVSLSLLKNSLLYSPVPFLFSFFFFYFFLPLHFSSASPYL